MSRLWEKDGMDTPNFKPDSVKPNDDDLRSSFHALWTRAACHSSSYDDRVWKVIVMQLRDAGLEVQ